MASKYLWRQRLLICVSLLGSLAANAAFARDPESYPMVCRGGDNSQIQIARDNGAVIYFEFRKGTAPASSGVGPGTCAWLDRAMRPEEPSEMVLRFRDADLTITIARRDGRDLVRYGVYGSNETNKTNLMRFVTAIQQGSEIQLHAYRDSRNRFVVTRFGP